MTFQDETLTIDTPENVGFGYQLAGIGSRFLACAVDTVLIAVLLFFVNLALTAFLSITDLLAEREDLAAWVTAIFSLLSFAVFWGYYIFFEVLWSGQTPGKRRNGLRVICRDGTPVTAGEAVIRNLVRIIDFLPAFYGVGIVTMFIDGQSWRLGDLAANTLVVRDREAIALSSLADAVSMPEAPAGAPQPASGLPVDRLPVERLSAQEIAMIEEFFRRRFELSNSDVIAGQLARSLCGRMGITPPLSQAGQAEQILAAILRAYRRQTQS